MKRLVSNRNKLFTIYEATIVYFISPNIPSIYQSHESCPEYSNLVVQFQVEHHI